jgi:sugar/nucleoside kinase (ribokinase family)
MTDLPRWKRLSAGGQDVTLNLDLDAEALPLARRMLDMGCAAVLVKCGVSGMVYATAGEGRLRETGRNLGLEVGTWAGQEGKVDSFPVSHVASATGAGDVSIAAFLAAANRGASPRRCALLASAEGACSVRTMDPVSGLLPLDTLAEIIDNNRWREEIACL